MKTSDSFEVLASHTASSQMTHTRGAPKYVPQV